MPLYCSSSTPARETVSGDFRLVLYLLFFSFPTLDHPAAKSYRLYLSPKLESTGQGPEEVPASMGFVHETL